MKPITTYQTALLSSIEEIGHTIVRFETGCIKSQEDFFDELGGLEEKLKNLAEKTFMTELEYMVLEIAKGMCADSKHGLDAGWIATKALEQAKSIKKLMTLEAE